jgi:hypothetical protein
MIRILLVLPLLMSKTVMAFTLSSVGFDGGWPGKTVGFYYNSSNCPEGVTAAMNKAFELWNSVPSSYLKVKLAGTSTATPAAIVAGGTGTTPTIACDTAFESNITGADGNAVGGVGFFNHSGGKITDGGLILNVQPGKSNNINTYNSTDLAILLAHEMGHVLGLGHSEFEPALMYYNIAAKEALNLSQDDIDGITYLYPRDELTDGMYGCGRTDSALPPSSGLATILLLLLPFSLLYLRRRSAIRFGARLRVRRA